MTGPTTAATLDFALALANEADAITMRYFRREAGVREKADGTPVTRADTEVETMLRARIAEAYPDHAVLGEEQGYAGGGSDDAPRWILDPIDGTASYARGIPIWATLIAFERDGTLEVGVASAPALDTRWWAGRGLGAHRARLPSGGGATDGERIHVSDRARIEEAQVLEGGFPSMMDAFPGAEVLLRSSWRTRSFSDFWGHCLVAEGSAEAMIEGEINPWDIAAMLVIVEEAGGRLTDIDGNATIESGHCITTNGALHDEVLRRLRG